jgi:hypothetical protein
MKNILKNNYYYIFKQTVILKIEFTKKKKRFSFIYKDTYTHPSSSLTSLILFLFKLS